ncbi:hypothetical protein CcrC1_gp259c [Caulobacter phage C1]|nr:hypothetical protein CcrC1_gp259c [Caulobacter phage C1]UTU08488.1 hypothetical protein CcrC2_gp260c [Caulobacter phage C2]UTU09003.1 hypothetical protein CcrJ4_gp254c [Caulobacter phage J4]UTU09564.1 hypothetical protein CcrBL47_gp278c [Caulobacter phage BL47]UTU10121.1 hypothetical protein CcrRB23_gp259c [Caulobacter phage RB23]WGN97156.1 hypothetical protein [Bertelyvirus sp.]
MADDEIKETHESFGRVQVLRTSGERNLVGVEWPVGHYLTLKVVEADRYTRGVDARFFGHREIIQIALSEVQFAQLITGVGTEGVPCTIQRRMVGGQYVGMAEPPTSQRADGHERAGKAIARDAQAAMAAVKEAVDMCQKILDGGSPRKAELRELLEQLQTALREATGNLPHLVDRATEQADKMRDRAYGEIEAYFELGKKRLGEQALAQAVAQGLLAPDKVDDVLKLAFETPQAGDAAES